MVKFLLTAIALLLAGILATILYYVLQPQQQPTTTIDPKQSYTFQKQWNVSFTNQNLSCLSEAIFHEAGVDSRMGKEAVGIVILNRAEERGVQNLCSIIHESKVIDGIRVCQFSYYCLPEDKRKNPTSGANWADSVFISIKLLNNKVNEGAIKLVSNATHYHADYVKPRWAKSLKYLGKIGSHLFYTDMEV